MDELKLTDGIMDIEELKKRIGKYVTTPKVTKQLIEISDPFLLEQLLNNLEIFNFASFNGANMDKFYGGEVVYTIYHKLESVVKKDTQYSIGIRTEFQGIKFPSIIWYEPKEKSN